MADHQEILGNAAADRIAAPTVDDAGALKARNAAALQKRKDAVAAAKAAEASAALPEGWKRVESNSRPGEYVYENLLTEERQAWFPVEAAKASTGAVGASVPAGKSKNQAALEKLKAKRAAEKEKLDNTPPPAGWIKVESNSRPGEFVYENSQTKERQAWFPDAPCISEAEIEKQNLKAKNIAALKARKAAADATRAAEATAPLPDGWTRVESRSRPGEFVYENKVTGERQAWLPTAAATSGLPEGWRKVESRTYPGEFVYENVHTMERQAWEPIEKAPMTEGQATNPAPAVAAEEAKVVICQATAQYDYTAQNLDEEIDLLEGDKIDVEYKADNGWWVGTNKRTNRSGIFPGTYVA